MELTFLGTSCMVPTKDRNHQSMFISMSNECFLVDCGEGTQRQLKIAGIKATRITQIFITHWHGDHVLGLPGLLQTLNGSEYDKHMDIYGPVGTIKYFDYMFKAFSFKIGFSHSIKEIKDGTTISLKRTKVVSKSLDHGLPCLGYAFIENDKRRIKTKVIKKIGLPDGPLLGKLQDNKEIIWKNRTVYPKDATYVVHGKKLAVILDTILCNNAYELAYNSDVLVCEASYASKLIEKATEYKHLTAKEAAQLASQSNVKKLILTHLSQRYKTSDEILEDAKVVFNETKIAFDFMKIKV